MWRRFRSDREFLQITKTIPAVARMNAVAAGLFVKVVGAFIQVFRPMTEGFRAIAQAAAAVTKVPRPVTKVPRPVTKVPRAVTKVPGAVTKVPRPVTKVPGAIAEVLRPTASAAHEAAGGACGEPPEHFVSHAFPCAPHPPFAFRLIGFVFQVCGERGNKAV